MKKQHLFLYLCLLLIGIACKSSTDATPNVAQEIVGTYNLSKLTKKGVAVTGGKGSVVVSMVDNSNVSMKISLSLGGSSIETTTNYNVAKNGTTYTIKDSGGATAGTITGGVLSANITIYNFGGSSDDYSAEFTK